MPNHARVQQSIGTGTYGSAASVTVPLTSLQTNVGGEPANLSGIIIRLTKGVGSIVRPSAANITIRDSSEVLFDGTIAELLGQMRERGEAIDAQLGAASASDSLLAIWRPGYGKQTEDQMGAAGLFTAGSVVITGPTDAGQTTTYEVSAILDGGRPRVHQRVITRTLVGSRDVPGDFLLARLRDSAFAVGNTYSVRSNSQELLTSLSGRTLQSQSESSLGPAGDPVTLTAIAASTLVPPNFVRSMLAEYSYGSGEKMPPLNRLPESSGNINCTSGFTANLVVTQIFPRSRAECERLAQVAAARAGVPYNGIEPAAADPALYRFSPIVVR